MPSASGPPICTDTTTPVPPSLAFEPAFELKCKEVLGEMGELFDDVECLQRRQILQSFNTNTTVPGPPRDRKWAWRTMKQYRLNAQQELEYQDTGGAKQWRRVVTREQIYSLVTDVHCWEVTHAGQDKTEAWISARYKGVPRKAVRLVVSGCQACNKRAQSKNRNTVQPITSHSVFEHIEIDLIDMSYLPTMFFEQEMKWICHIKDHFSKYSQAYAIPRKTAQCVHDILLRWITAFGPPAILQSDNGLEFCNSLVTGLAVEYRFKVTHGRPYHPQAQGLVEQANGVIKDRLAKWMSATGRKDWPAGIPHVIRSMNNTVHSSLPKRSTPTFVVFGRHSRLLQASDVSAITSSSVEPDVLPVEGSAQGSGGHLSDEEFDGIESVADGTCDREIDEDNVEDCALPPTTSTSCPITLHQVLDAVMVDSTPLRTLSPAEEAPPLPVRSPLHAAVRQKQVERQHHMIRRWGDSGKTLRFKKGSPVTLRLPAQRLHGVDVTREPCLVLEEVRPQYYRLLCALGIVQGLHRPGQLQPLVGHTFPDNMMSAFRDYRDGTEGHISLNTIVQSITAVGASVRQYAEEGSDVEMEEVDRGDSLPQRLTGNLGRQAEAGSTVVRGSGLYARGYVVEPVREQSPVMLVEGRYLRSRQLS